MSNDKSPRTRVTRPDLAAMPDQPAPIPDTPPVDVPEDPPAEDAVEQVQPVAAARKTLDLPVIAEGNTVRDASGRFVAVCGGTHQSVEQRIGLAKLVADAINGFLTP